MSMQVQSMRDRMRLGDTKLSTVVDPINAPVCSEPDQGNGQGEGQDQAEKLAMSPPYVRDHVGVSYPAIPY